MQAPGMGAGVSKMTVTWPLHLEPHRHLEHLLVLDLMSLTSLLALGAGLPDVWLKKLLLE